jgi:dipeptidyl aminopeptidase/acylaminoacyl peptidase
MRHALRIILLVAFASPVWADGRPMTVDDLLAVKSVGDAHPSPDGKWVVYVVSEIDRKTNKSNSDLWLVPLAGGEPKRLTSSPGADNHPRWSPDGSQIAFVSDRGGSAQIWLLPMDGGEAKQLTHLPIDVAGPIWSPTGKKLAFVAEVYPGKTADETAATDKEKAESKSKARVYDQLMIRHWSAWDEGKRSHLFVADAKTGEARDLTPKLEVHTPPAPFGGSNDYAFSPDGEELAFTAEPIKDLAWSTNTDIWTVPVEGGEMKNITESSKGADAQPSYARDGQSIAYVSQARAGFEADRWVLTVQSKDGHTTKVSGDIDRPVLSYVWADSDQRFFAVIDDEGGQSIIELAALPHRAADLARSRRVQGGSNAGLELSSPAEGHGRDRSSDGARLVFTHASADHPGEVYTARADGSSQTALTHHNDSLLEHLDLSKAEAFSFKGADGDKVSGWLLKPPGYKEGRKYPLLFLIHGGPQGAWHDEWSARWNYQLFAAPGYAIVAINPRGSTGYGQKFTDQISRDWTGRVYDDLMKGLDYALKTYPFLDENRVAAAGGSFGGFMVNWIAGHTDRFKALISHAGVFDLTSKYGTTEELWFPEWEFGGTPWDHPEVYREQSPSSFVQNFKTPTLVIHGALDFRVPDAQGLGMFTALQRRRVPSRYLFFPDEGHWILKPQNRVVWWKEMHGWLAKYLDAKGY